MVSSMSIAQEKDRLRKQMLARRAQLPPVQKLEASAAMAHHFADHPYLTYAVSFAGYYAIGSELDVLPIFNRMVKFGKQMALPVVVETSAPLQFHLWQPGQPLKQGAHGVKEPQEETDSVVPEVVLVPLLAIDKAGYRLGYGGGYYDRTLQMLRESQEKPPLFIGIAHSSQELDDLPHDTHDQPLDGILTEQGVSMF